MQQKNLFAKRLRELRGELRKSQAEMASDLGIPRTTLGGYELEGKQPDYDMLCRIVDYFGVTTDYILGHSDARRSTDEIILCDNKNFMHHYDNLPDEAKAIVAGLFDDFYVLLSRDMQQANEQHLAAYADLFAQLRSNRSKIKNLAAETISQPSRATALMAQQEQLKTNIAIALSKLVQADMDLAQGKKSEELSSKAAT